MKIVERLATIPFFLAVFGLLDIARWAWVRADEIGHSGFMMNVSIDAYFARATCCGALVLASLILIPTSMWLYHTVQK